MSLFIKSINQITNLSLKFRTHYYIQIDIFKKSYFKIQTMNFLNFILKHLSTSIHSIVWCEKIFVVIALSHHTSER